MSTELASLRDFSCYGYCHEPVHPPCLSFFTLEGALCPLLFPTPSRTLNLRWWAALALPDGPGPTDSVLYSLSPTPDCEVLLS